MRREIRGDQDRYKNPSVSFRSNYNRARVTNCTICDGDDHDQSECPLKPIDPVDRDDEMVHLEKKIDDLKSSMRRIEAILQEIRYGNDEN